MVTRQAIDLILRDAAQAAPREACGLLLGDAGKVTQARPAANIHPAPETHFEIDPRALIDAHRGQRGGGLQLLGYYHSHPSGAAEPSATDSKQAAGDGKVWAIIAQGVVRFWLDGSDGFEPLSHEMSGG